MDVVDQEDMTDEERIARRLEDEAPWETVSKVLSHEGWLDVVETIKTTAPAAYEALRTEYLK